MMLGAGKLQAELDRVQRSMIIAALIEFDCKIARAAKDLGISRPSMYAKIAELHIDIHRLRDLTRRRTA